MQKRAYVLEPDIWMIPSAHSVVLQLGAPVILASRASVMPPLFAQFELAVVLAERAGEPHRFPSKHIRVLASLEAARGRGYHVPPCMSSFLDGRHAEVLVIRDRPDMEKTYAALRSYHLRDPRTGAWLGEKKKKPSRLEHLAERRRARREQYALP